MVLLDAEGRPIRGALSSEKAYKKSLESGTLWGVNPETGRVLPLEGVRRLAGIERDGMSVTARVVLAEAGAGGAPGPEPRAADREADAGRKTNAGRKTGAPPGREPPVAAGVSGVLEALEQVIASRRVEMKEGSYTTYLFEKGLEKIRKKTGEEAIELLLATDPKEVTSEAADLVYHLLVLLRALEIPLSAVLDELETRLKR